MIFIFADRELIDKSAKFVPADRIGRSNDWRTFPLSPALPLSGNLPASAISNFVVQNLLPEGDQLEAVSRALSISKASIFGLIAAIGQESAGALSCLVGMGGLASHQPTT